MPEPSTSDRGTREVLRDFSRRVIDAINNSSVGKAVESQVKPNPQGSAPRIALYEKAAEATPQPKPVLQPGDLHKAIVAVQGKAKPVVKAVYDATATPRAAAQAALTAGGAMARPEPKTSPRDAQAQQLQSQVDLLKYVQEQQRIRALKERLTAHN